MYMSDNVVCNDRMYVTETTMQPEASCTASCMNAPLPSTLVYASAAPTQNSCQFFKLSAMRHPQHLCR
ncbi:hypothetical protein SeMB42_g00298 [Synchytrium endobioticum]|uniref:Uncharacterized protein n=1 Tax=Synchytrium endobioticum TaxID=286115 RepID=A0A507DJ01_9FUNG|nr:hypothetical protein SeLEV6574_g00676 [Synchytrium endobioticum]TPX54372.1 hypothetical protein SeMB42_g00298 [Synchytrium endobioticum]